MGRTLGFTDSAPPMSEVNRAKERYARASPPGGPASPLEEEAAADAEAVVVLPPALRPPERDLGAGACGG